MDYLPFLLALLHVHKALCGEILWDTTVEWNENLTLECAHSPTKLLTQLVWLKHSGQKKDRIATFNPTMGLEITKPYANRVSIKNSTAASNVLILSFKKASEADLGFYTCHFYTFPDGGMEKIIQVVTTDNFESLASLNETIPELASGTGQNITLTYQFQMKGPVKRVTWEKIQPHQTDVLTSCNLLEERSYTANYQLQAWANCRNGSRASLLFIPSLTASAAAIYRCLVEGSAGERETYWVRLTVHQPQIASSHQVLHLKAQDQWMTWEGEARPIGGTVQSSHQVLVTDEVKFT
ncbi:CD226 antigen [Perognathus longimembris pacificus]|uniref:CD226 antigen n=1 Tax=Perognathus longimembris pacificus TaxID=214514 RepID=UPI0020190E40|nr:CD226 antigen [Perognathus longimembris pacificus]